jgi:hypothetical protein
MRWYAFVKSIQEGRQNSDSSGLSFYAIATAVDG